VEVSQQAGLPREISGTALAETTDRAVPADAHAPHLVDANSASERFAANDVVTPLLECLPSHRHIFAEGQQALNEITNPTAVRGTTPHQLEAARIATPTWVR
jgi:hypothetical protein